MYQFSDNLDWSFLHGKEVTQVCISPRSVTINMSGDVSINIQSSFEHLILINPQSNNPGFAKRATTLVSLLGTLIISAILADQSSLIIGFSNSEELRLIDDDPYYESFTFSYPGKTIGV